MLGCDEGGVGIRGSIERLVVRVFNTIAQAIILVLLESIVVHRLISISRDEMNCKRFVYFFSSFPRSRWVGDYTWW